MHGGSLQTVAPHAKDIWPRGQVKPETVPGVPSPVPLGGGMEEMWTPEPAGIWDKTLTIAA